MSELFDDENDLNSEDVFVDSDKAILNYSNRSSSDARRRLESLLEEKRLRDELEDFMDY